MGRIITIFLLLVLLTPSTSKLKHDGMTDVFNLLKNCGFRPTNVLDVGANVGAWTGEMKGIFPDATYLMVEGNEQHRGRLQSVGAPFEISLVGKAPGNLTYYRRRNDAMGTGNSVYKENTQFYDENQYDKVTLAVRRLDDIAAKHSVGPFQLLKIDVQGAEVDAIQGATKILESVDVIYTECSLMNYNHGAPPFLDLYVLLDHFGFAFFTVANHFYKDGLCLQFDAFFVKKTSGLWNQSCTHFPTPMYFNETKKYFDVFPG